MRRRFAATMISLVLIAVCMPSLAAATYARLSSDNPAALDHADIVRLIGAAEAAYFQTAARYALFSELVRSGQLARTAAQSSAYSRVMQLLTLSESQPVPGSILALVVTSDGRGYQLSLKVVGDSCSPGWFSDQSGVLYQGKALDCAVAAALAPASARTWSPEDIDAVVPPVSIETPCPLDQVLHEASQQALQLVENLQRFSAKERIEHIEFGKDGKKHNSSAQSVNYVAEIQQNSRALWVDEY